MRPPIVTATPAHGAQPAKETKNVPASHEPATAHGFHVPHGSQLVETHGTLQAGVLVSDTVGAADTVFAGVAGVQLVTHSHVPVATVGKALHTATASVTNAVPPMGTPDWLAVAIRKQIAVGSGAFQGASAVMNGLAVSLGVVATALGAVEIHDISQQMAAMQQAHPEDFQRAEQRTQEWWDQLCNFEWPENEELNLTKEEDFRVAVIEYKATQAKLAWASLVPTLGGVIATTASVAGCVQAVPVNIACSLLGGGIMAYKTFGYDDPEWDETWREWRERKAGEALRPIAHFINDVALLELGEQPASELATAQLEATALGAWTQLQRAESLLKAVRSVFYMARLFVAVQGDPQTFFQDEEKVANLLDTARSGALPQVHTIKFFNFKRFWRDDGKALDGLHDVDLSAADLFEVLLRCELRAMTLGFVDASLKETTLEHMGVEADVEAMATVISKTLLSTVGEHMNPRIRENDMLAYADMAAQFGFLDGVEISYQAPTKKLIFHLTDLAKFERDWERIQADAVDFGTVLLLKEVQKVDGASVLIPEHIKQRLLERFSDEGGPRVLEGHHSPAFAHELQRAESLQQPVPAT